MVAAVRAVVAMEAALRARVVGLRAEGARAGGLRAEVARTAMARTAMAMPAWEVVATEKAAAVRAAAEGAAAEAAMRVAEGETRGVKRAAAPQEVESLARVMEHWAAAEVPEAPRWAHRAACLVVVVKAAMAVITAVGMVAVAMV